VLRALDDLAHDEAVGEVGVAVRADPVSGMEGVVFRTIDGVGVLFVIEANDVTALDQRAITDMDPAFRI
jgi:hypothetical protein